jgi:K+-sensing histidine kinase KdpD
LAGDLAAEFVWLKSEDVVDAIVAFAQERTISKIIVGRSRRSILSRLFRRATPERFIRETRGFDVEVLRDESRMALPFVALDCNARVTCSIG